MAVALRAQHRTIHATVASFGFLRIGCLLVGLAMGIVTVGFYARASWAVSLLPWSEAKMSYIFLASLSAAACASLIWIGLTGEVAAIADMTIDTVVTYVGTAIFLAIRSINTDDLGLMVGAVFSGLAAFGGIFLYRWAKKLPVRDKRLTPQFVRHAFLFFTIVLVLVSGALILRIDGVFPWNLQPETSTLFGIMFVGSAVYFGYGWWHETWAHGAGQLWAFLAYDLVLFTPYIKMLFEKSEGAATSVYGSFYGSTVSGNGINERSLVPYLFVLSVSTALAIFCFGFYRSTRIRIGQPPV